MRSGSAFTGLDDERRYVRADLDREHLSGVHPRCVGRGVEVIPHSHVDVAEVLCHLAGRTNAPSSMGSQLDRLAMQSEAKKHGPGWTTHAKPSRPTPKDPDGAILRDAAVYRLISDLGRIRSVDIENANTLLDIHAEQGGTVGRVIVLTLRAFQEALVAPSDEDIERAKKRAEKATPARRAEVIQRAIAEYRAPRGVEAVRSLFGLKTTLEATELYGDCLLVLSTYVQTFNRRKKAA